MEVRVRLELYAEEKKNAVLKGFSSAIVWVGIMFSFF